MICNLQKETVYNTNKAAEGRQQFHFHFFIMKHKKILGIFLQEK